MAKDPQYISLKEAAVKLKVSPKHILKWAKEGKFNSTGVNTNDPKIEAKSLWKFAKEMSPEWGNAFGETMMEEIKSIFPIAQREVNQAFSRGIEIRLGKIKEIIVFLQSLHSKYEKNFDLWEEKSGRVASIITFARAITLLNSIVQDIEKEGFTAATVTFRPLSEAIQLTEYFSLANNDAKEQGRIKAWFSKGAVIMNKDIRGYIANQYKLILPEFNADEYQELTRRLFDSYSKPLHHTYRSIMDTYKGYSIDGFMGDIHTGLDLITQMPQTSVI